MRTLVILLFTLLSASLVAQSSPRAPEAETEYYEFHINYWFNMHHLLWIEAYSNTHLESSIIDVELNAEENEALDAAVRFYRENMIQYDLRQGSYMGEFRDWITQQGSTIATVPAAFRPHTKVMFGFDAVYRRHFWSAHQNACELVLEQNLPLIEATEKVYVEEISLLTREAWQKKRIPVDITYFGKITKRNLRNRPYTTIFPTHVVMNTLGDDQIEGAWLELLYQQSASHLVLRNSSFVTGTIKDVGEINKLQVPQTLWRGYSFYLAGSLSQQLLRQQGIDYPYTYTERNGVFSQYQGLLDTHLAAYMERKATLADATLQILQGLQE
ncbi:MAG: hypothetical protein AAFO03_00140 [Bacteroidota bacterium]